MGKCQDAIGAALERMGFRDKSDKTLSQLPTPIQPKIEWYVVNERPVKSEEDVIADIYSQMPAKIKKMEDQLATQTFMFNALQAKYDAILEGKELAEVIVGVIETSPRVEEVMVKVIRPIMHDFKDDEHGEISDLKHDVSSLQDDVEALEKKGELEDGKK